MDFQAIILEKEEHIASITLNRPDKLNAVSEQMVTELIAAFSDVAQDEDVRVLVLTGAGQGFCAGADASGKDKDSIFDEKVPGKILHTLI